MSMSIVDEQSVSDRGLTWQLLCLAGPIVASMVSRTAMNFIDFAMISVLGTEAQAAVGAATMALFTVICLGMGTMMVMHTFVSQALGREDFRGCSAYAWQGLYVGLAMGLATLPLWWAIPPFFEAVGHEAPVQRLENQYAQIGLLGLGPQVMAMGMSGFFTGIHRPSVSLVAMVASNLLNVVLNYVLIYGNWGSPAMGVTGAAWATNIATAFSVLVMLAWMLRSKYRSEYHADQTWRPDVKRMVNLLRVGLPVGVMFSFDVFTWAIFTNFVMGQLGTVALAANNAAFKFLELSFMPGMGVGSAVGVAVGRSIGMGKPDLAKRFARAGMTLTWCYMFSVGVLFLLFRHPMMDLLSDDAAVIEAGAVILIFCAVFQAFDAMTVNYGGALRGAGDTMFPAVGGVVMGILVIVGGSLLVVHLRPQWGVAGPWTVASLHVILYGFMLAGRWRSGRWRHIRIESHDTPEFNIVGPPLAPRED